MGTWGYEPLDNDAALEIQYIWENYVEDRLGNWDEDDIVEYFIHKRWQGATECGDNITNSEIIALLELFKQRNLSIPKTLKKISQDAINRELVTGELESWEDPEKREKSLKALMKSIDGKIKKPKKKGLIKDRSLTFKNKDQAEKELVKMTRFGKKLMFSFDLFNNDELKKEAPDFLKTLDRFVHHGLWEKDSNISTEAQAQRLMMIAFYLGMSLGYDREKIHEMIKDARWEKK